MNCNETRQQLSEYLDGHLTSDHRGAVEAHLGQCALCQTEVDALRQTIQGVAAMSPVELPPGFTKRVMAHVRGEAERPGRWRALFIPLWAKIPIHATAVLLVGGMALYLYQASQPQAPMQVASRPPVEIKKERFAGDGAQLKTKEMIAEDRLEPMGSVTTAETVGRRLDESAEQPAEQKRPTPSLPSPPAELHTPVAGFKDEKSAAVGGALVEQEMTAATESLATIQERAADRTLILTAHPSHRDAAQLTNKITALAEQLGGTPEPAAPSKNTAEADRLRSAAAPRPEVVWVMVPADRYEQFSAALADMGTLTADGAGIGHAAPPAVADSMMTQSAQSELQPVPRQLRIKLTLVLPE